LSKTSARQCPGIVIRAQGAADCSRVRALDERYRQGGGSL